jgi:hypothetical protein
MAKPGGKPVLAIGAVVLLALGAAGALLILRSGRRALPPAVPPPVAIVTPSASAAPQVLATPEPTVMPAASATALPTVAPTAAPAATPVSRPNAQVPRTVASNKPAAATGKPSCDPPYYFDAQGARIFKKECL